LPPGSSRTAQFRASRWTTGSVLVSDPKFKSAAALVVNVGQIDDPKEREGLAHFTEHMLFLGIEKYRGPPYIARTAAPTTRVHASDHQLSIQMTAFAGALIAGAILHRQFNPEFAREVNAVTTRRCATYRTTPAAARRRARALQRKVAVEVLDRQQGHAQARRRRRRAFYEHQ
jgi:predicted Zn-dependent peptidase